MSAPIYFFDPVPVGAKRSRPEPSSFLLILPPYDEERTKSDLVKLKQSWRTIHFHDAQVHRTQEHLRTVIGHYGNRQQKMTFRWTAQRAMQLTADDDLVETTVKIIKHAVKSGWQQDTQDTVLWLIAVQQSLTMAECFHNFIDQLVDTGVFTPSDGDTIETLAARAVLRESLQYLALCAPPTVFKFYDLMSQERRQQCITQSISRLEQVQHTTRRIQTTTTEVQSPRKEPLLDEDLAMGTAAAEPVIKKQCVAPLQ